MFFNDVACQTGIERLLKSVKISRVKFHITNAREQFQPLCHILEIFSSSLSMNSLSMIKLCASAAETISAKIWENFDDLIKGNLTNFVERN